MSLMFCDQEHRAAYEYWINAVECPDSYHQALLYTLAICPDTRSRIQRIYDPHERMIDPSVLNEGWQTSSSRRVCLIAFNLFNGFIDSTDPYAATPYDLFCCSYAPYFLQAVQLRYPEYFCK